MCRGLTTYDLKAARSVRIIQQHTGQGTVGVLHRSGGSFVALHADPDRTGPDHTAEMTDGIVGTVFIDCAGCSIGQDRCMTEVPKVVGPALTIQKQVPIKEALTSVVQIMQIIAGITGILDSRTGEGLGKKQPGMGALAGAGALQRERDAVCGRRPQWRGCRPANWRHRRPAPADSRPRPAAWGTGR